MGGRFFFRGCVVGCEAVGLLQEGSVDSNGELDPFLLRLLGSGTVQIDDVHGFSLKHHDANPNARRSPIKINLATPDVRPEGRLTLTDVRRMARFMVLAVKEKKLEYSGVAGVPNAGNRLAEAFVQEYYDICHASLPLLTLEKDADKRHVGKLLKVSEGLPRGENILIIDDVATRATSKEEASEVLRHEGYWVKDCLVFVDREEGAREILRKSHVELHSVTTLKYMVDLYCAEEKITAVQYNAVCDYIENAQKAIAKAA
jgi:orotate phosphoribosyltransferase